MDAYDTVTLLSLGLDVSLLMFVYHSLLFQNNGEKMGEKMLLVKISKRFQERLPFLEGKVPVTISVTHPVTLSACLLLFLGKHCTTSTEILSSTGSSCTA